MGQRQDLIIVRLRSRLGPWLGPRRVHQVSYIFIYAMNKLDDEEDDEDDEDEDEDDEDDEDEDPPMYL